MTHHNGPWAHPPRGRQEQSLAPRLMFGLALAFATGCGLAVFAFGDVPPLYEPPRGHDICQTKGC